MSSSVMDGHMSRVFALTYHPSDSRILLSAGWDDTVQVRHTCVCVCVYVCVCVFVYVCVCVCDY